MEGSGALLTDSRQGAHLFKERRFKISPLVCVDLEGVAKSAAKAFVHL